MTSPTQQTLREMRKRGYFCAITEHWNSFVKRRQDLFGFCDVLAIRENSTIAIQTTSNANVAARLNKITQTEGAIRWLQSPDRRILIHGWAKRGPRGKRKIWTCREVEVTPIVMQRILNGLKFPETMYGGEE